MMSSEHALMEKSNLVSLVGRRQWSILLVETARAPGRRSIVLSSSRSLALRRAYRRSSGLVCLRHFSGRLACLITRGVAARRILSTLPLISRRSAGLSITPPDSNGSYTCISRTKKSLEGSDLIHRNSSSNCLAAISHSSSVPTVILKQPSQPRSLPLSLTTTPLLSAMVL